jgi:NADH pyrophosphatase NudC (nudix superfamily)
LGIRNRYDAEGGNSLYIVMLLRPQSGEPNPDMTEVDRAEYFSLAEIEAMEQISPINIEVAKRALAEDHRIFHAQTVEQAGRGAYTLFLG